MHIVPAEEVTQGTHMTFTDAKVSKCSFLFLFFFVCVCVFLQVFMIFKNADVNECKTEHISCGGMNTCVNTQGGHHCVGDKKKAILIGKITEFLLRISLENIRINDKHIRLLYGLQGVVQVLVL